MTPHLCLTVISFLSYCCFSLDFQLPFLVAGIASRRLASNSLPSFMTWEMGIASRDHSTQIPSFLSRPDVRRLPHVRATDSKSSRSSSAVSSSEILLFFAFSVSKVLLTSKCPQLSPALCKWLNLVRHIETSRPEKIQWSTHVGSLC